MEVLTDVISIQEAKNTQSITKKNRACRKECYKQNSARKRCRMRHNQMEGKKIRQNMVSTGKYGKIVRSIKAQPRSPLPATATKHMTEAGIEIQGTFASEIQKEGKVIGWRSDATINLSDNQRRNGRNKNWTGRLENYKDAMERGTTRREDDTAQQHQYKGDQAHDTMLN